MQLRMASRVWFEVYHHIHSWLLPVVPKTLVVSIVWFSNINACLDCGLHRLIYTENILLKAFQSILSDPDFDVPSQPAIAARKSASLILSWCRTVWITTVGHRL